MPVRKIKASKGYAFRGKEPSPKSPTGMVYWESLLELGAVKLFNFDPRIDSIEHQPLTLKFNYQGKEHHYTPDFKLGTTNGETLLVEVKPDKFVKDTLVRVKLEVGRAYAARMGWRFKLLTEEDINKGHLQTNLDTLLDVRDYMLNRVVVDQILGNLTTAECSPAELHCRVNAESESEFYINLYLMIYQQTIYTDLVDSELDKEWSKLRLPMKGDWENCGAL